jgi:molybdopterin adenylyltransferase
MKPGSRTKHMQNNSEVLLIGLVSISDRASAGVYKDEGIPALEDWFSRAIAKPSWRTEKRA